MHTGSGKHTTSKEKHGAEQRPRPRILSQLLLRKEVESFSRSRLPHCAKCLLGRDAQHHDLPSDPLQLLFLPLQASRLELTGQPKEKEMDEGSYLILLVTLLTAQS